MWTPTPRFLYEYWVPLGLRVDIANVPELVVPLIFAPSVRTAGGLVPRRECVLTGDEGSLRFDGEVLSFGRRGDSGITPVDIPAHERGAWRVERDFVEAIRGLAPVRLTTFEDGVRYMAFTQAVADSLASGRLQPVEDLPG